MPASLTKLSALSNAVISGLYPSGSAESVTFEPHFLSCLRIKRIVTDCLQGSIPGSWLAITCAGFTPASLCSNARQAEEMLSAPNHFRLEIEHFSACVLNGPAPQLALNDAKANCQIIVATLQTAKVGQRVNLD